MATRKQLVIEPLEGTDLIRIRRGFQWCIGVTRTEAIELANMLVDYIEQEQQP